MLLHHNQPVSYCTSSRNAMPSVFVVTSVLTWMLVSCGCAGGDGHSKGSPQLVSLLQVRAVGPNASLFRQPLDRRNGQCISREYDLTSMPTVSVIIPYLHESLELMQQTVVSLLKNTPSQLLDVILFVDDGNDREHQHAGALRELDPKVSVHRNVERQGLIEAKITGAARTQSPVIVFMEPHCIANRQWLQPLLTQLLDSHTSVAVPVIDIIPEANNHGYDYVIPSMYGAFDWKLTFTWPGSAASRNASYVDPDPFPMPALSGGIFALWRDWWEQSGTYDREMREWGGENIEMSLRMWRCGGSIIEVPCSRIGHMFRKARPYEFNGYTYTRNNKRLAAVWLENYLNKSIAADHRLSDMSDVGPLEERMALKERLGCKSMDWYVDNVFPELKFLSSDGH